MFPDLIFLQVIVCLFPAFRQASVRRLWDRCTAIRLQSTLTREISMNSTSNQKLYFVSIYIKNSYSSCCNELNELAFMFSSGILIPLVAWSLDMDFNTSEWLFLIFLFHLVALN